MPTEPKPANPSRRWRISARSPSSTSRSSTSRPRPAVSDISFDARARRDGRVRRAVRRGQDHARQAARRALYRPQAGTDMVQRPSPARRSISTRSAQIGLRHAGHAALLRHDPREPAVRQSEATDADCLDVLREGGVRQPAGARRPRARHGDRRRRREGVRAARSSACRSRARCCASRSLLVFDEATSSLDSLTEEEHRRNDPRRLREQRRHHDPHRAPALDDPARRSHLRPRARKDRRIRGGTTSWSKQKGLYYAMWRQQIGEARDPERGSLVGEKELIMKN
jgi:ATP-binding cassette subfamily B protein